MPIQTVSHLIYAIQCIQLVPHSHALSTRFKPLYMNMYRICLTDGVVSRLALSLKIYGVTYVALKIRFRENWTMYTTVVFGSQESASFLQHSSSLFIFGTIFVLLYLIKFSYSILQICKFVNKFLGTYIYKFVSLSTYPILVLSFHATIFPTKY